MPLKLHLWVESARYNNTWSLKAQDADEGKSFEVFTNLGGTIDGTEVTELEAGGANFEFEEEGAYTVELVLDENGDFTLGLEKTGDAPEPAPAFPEAIYLVGNATDYGWPPLSNNDPNHNADAIMHKTAGGDTDGIYWKIAYLEGGAGFKLAGPGWANPNLGFAEIEADPDGAEITDADGNMSVADDNMYMIVLNLRESGSNKVSVKEAAVYGAGDTYDGWWPSDNQKVNNATKYAIDVAAKTMTSPAFTGDGEIRIYAYHDWITAWWQAEFVPVNGIIEYRNDGPDQDRYPGTTGQVVTLKFDDNTATVTN